MNHPAGSKPTTHNSKTGTRRVGIVGTLVWDRIFRPGVHEGGGTPIQDWGGVAYSWSSVAAALGTGWEAVPLVKVGADLHAESRAFLAQLPGVDADTGVLRVEEPTNRVELHYQTESTRTERLSGGVPSWRWEELEPLVRSLDALYVNFISGFEMGLEDAESLRAGFHGPIYADLHSLFLARHPDGRRAPRTLRNWKRWLACFDGVQVNESEMKLLATSHADPFVFANSELWQHTRMLVVTLGEGGIEAFVDPALPNDPMCWAESRGQRRTPFRQLTVPPPSGPLPGDPTGCGDVWGGAYFTSLLAGHDIEASARRASAAAARKLERSGATGLYRRLRETLGSERS